MIWFAEGYIRVREIRVPHDAFDCVDNLFRREPLDLFAFCNSQGLQGAGCRHILERWDMDMLSRAVMRRFSAPLGRSLDFSAVTTRWAGLQTRLSQACCM